MQIGSTSRYPKRPIQIPTPPKYRIVAKMNLPASVSTTTTNSSSASTFTTTTTTTTDQPQGEGGELEPLCSESTTTGNNGNKSSVIGPFHRRHSARLDKNSEPFLVWLNRVGRIKQKIVMFMIGVSFHIFSVFRYNYLMDCVGTTKGNYSYASSVVCLASFFVSNIWVFVAQRSRLLFGTFVTSSITGSACLLAIRMLQSSSTDDSTILLDHPSSSATTLLFLVKFSLFCVFFGCLKSFFSIAATATIKNLTDKKYYAEQFCFFLLGSIAVNTLFSYRRFEPVMLNFFWICWTIAMVMVFKLLVGVKYFDEGSGELTKPRVLYSTIAMDGERGGSISQSSNYLIISNDSTTNNSQEQEHQQQQQEEEEEGYYKLFSNSNYRFFLLIATLIGYTCSTFIIFAPSLQAEDLELTISDRTKIESFGNVSELAVYISFRFLFPSIPPYWLIMICCLGFLIRSLGYIGAVVVCKLFLLDTRNIGFWIILGSDGLKGFIFGMLQPSYITFIAWYCSSGNKSIALGIYNGIFYGVTGFVCGIGSGALRGYLQDKIRSGGSSGLSSDSIFWWMLGTNCSAFVVAIGCLILAIALLIIRFWVLRIGREPDFKNQ